MIEFDNIHVHKRTKSEAAKHFRPRETWDDLIRRFIKESEELNRIKKRDNAIAELEASGLVRRGKPGERGGVKISDL